MYLHHNAVELQVIYPSKMCIVQVFRDDSAIRSYTYLLITKEQIQFLEFLLPLSWQSSVFLFYFLFVLHFFFLNKDLFAWSNQIFSITKICCKVWIYFLFSALCFITNLLQKKPVLKSKKVVIYNLWILLFLYFKNNTKSLGMPGFGCRQI